MAKSPGQVAYETDLWLRPLNHDGSLRATWAQLPEYARYSWDRDPTYRTNGQRAQLRMMLRQGATMDHADYLRRSGRVGVQAHRRFVRLWAVSTATEHPYTRAWSLDRWRSRRAAVTAAVRGFLAKES